MFIEISNNYWSFINIDEGGALAILTDFEDILDNFKAILMN